MIYIEIMGGLGNQLFQIFCGIAYSLENNIPFKIKGYQIIDYVLVNTNKYRTSFILYNNASAFIYLIEVI